MSARLPGLRTAPLFATPICVYDIEDRPTLWPALADLVLAETERDAGLTRSNAGSQAWHSGRTFLSGDAPALAELRDLVRDAAQSLLPSFVPRLAEPPRLALDGWANVLRTGGYNAAHAHPGAALSLVLYAAGEASPPSEGPLAGRLELFDPRPLPPRGEDAPERCLVAPLPGRLVAFPGWLHHMVHPSVGDAPRISFAFNVTARSA